VTFDLQHIGHAGFIFSHGRVTLLMDPWFYPAWFEAWAPYPDNSQFACDAVNRPNWVYVSHHHPDHWDARFLDGLERDIQVICPKYRSRRMERLWKGLGFTRVRALSHGESLNLDSKVKVTMLLDRGYREDSALLIEAGGKRFLNQNDCELASPDIPQADILAAQYAPASWYPHCYAYDDAVYNRKAEEMRNTVFNRIRHYLHVSKATTYIPSAGPACFPDPALRQFNAGEPRGKVFWEWTAKDSDYLSTTGVGTGSFNSRYPDSPGAYLDRLWENPLWRAYYDRDSTPATVSELDEHFRKLCRNNSYLLKNYQRGIAVDQDGTWAVNLAVVAGELEEAPDPTYWIKVPNRVMRAILNGTETWEIALTSWRCTLKRDPDVYDSTLMTLINFGDEPAITRAYKQGTEANEMINHHGVTHQRWCPHAGEDLTYATVKDGKITCPRHEWCWDAETGECLSGGDIPLKVNND